MKRLYLLAAGVASCLAVTAAPVRPGQTVEVTAGATTVTLTLHGDEYHHYYATPEGCPALLTAQGWRLASVEADGSLTASQYVPVAAVKMTEGQRAFVARNSSAQALERLTSASMRNRAAMTPATGVRKAAGLFPNSTYPISGSPKALVLLVEFADKPMSLANAHDYFAGLLNTPGFSEWGATGSALDFYNFSSMGQFTPSFDVYGPVTLPEDGRYYGGNTSYGSDMQPWKMAVDACTLLDGEVDFSQYDTDGDGQIDNVFIFYAGRGEASGGGPDCIWPHAGYVGSNAGQEYRFDGVRLYRYACTNEWGNSSIDNSERPDGIGTFVHEFSHVMGLPDLYTTQYTGAFTPGAWDTMDQGPYSNDGRTPPMLTAFERYALEWLEPVDISAGMQVLLPNLGENQAAIIPTYRENEYFLMENRQQSGWDSHIPGHGMLVWHIEYESNIWNQNLVNNNNAHQYVDIEEADNYLSEANRAGDSFPGAMGITSFTDDTTPSMRTWSGRGLECPLTGITEDNGIITFQAGDGATAKAVSEVLLPTDCHSTGFTARWTQAEGRGHVLSVYTRSRSGQVEYAPGYKMLPLGEADHCEVAGLQPGTIYCYTVRNVDGLALSQPSAEALAYTGDNGMENFQVTALAATDIEPTSFTANWEPLFGAQGYVLSVGRVSGGGELTTTALDFADGVNWLPDGWNTFKTTDCTLSAYVGQESPSAKVGAGGYIESPDLGGGLVSLSFWQRGNGAPEGSVIKIEELLDGTWSETAAVAVESQAGGGVSTVEGFAGGRAFRLSLETPTGKGSVCIDDIEAVAGSELSVVPVEGYDALAVAGTQAAVGGLYSDTDYVYTVRATDGDLLSRASSVIRVRTKYDAGVAGTADMMPVRTEGLTIFADGPVTVSDLTGCVVARGEEGAYTMPAHGAYIVATAEGTFKVVL